MPTHVRAQVAWQSDSALPRDQHMINPCFRLADTYGLLDTDWQALADGLATGINNWTITKARQLTVKLYEIKDPVAGAPNRPKATKVLNAALNAPTIYPAEVSLCLSFYGGPNGPSNRGRNYLPYYTLATDSPPARPDSSIRNRLVLLPPVFAGLGGVDVDWIVWSPTKKAATKVDHWFIDDEWDTQRKRGLRPTTRTAGVTSG